jgi:Flp pilus assembly protein TadD
LLSQGKVEAARSDFRKAVVKDPSDWESWADLALVTQGAERQEAARHARSLNALEQVLRTGD